MPVADLLGHVQSLASGIWTGAILGVLVLVLSACYVLAWAYGLMRKAATRLQAAARTQARRERKWSKVQRMERKHLARQGLTVERQRRAS